jgi:hypothetical protein
MPQMIVTSEEMDPHVGGQGRGVAGCAGAHAF